MRVLLSTLLSLMMATSMAAQSTERVPGGVVGKTRACSQAGPFDPARDPAKDLEAAKAEARKSGRRILLDVGGNWCSWCRLMDKWFTERPAVREARDKAFVVVPVNFSPENKNEAFLAHYPKIDGYPHFFVLDADGKLVRDQSTGELEDGHGYGEAKMMAFIAAWSGK